MGDFAIVHPFVDLKAFISVPIEDWITYTRLHDFVKNFGIMQTLESWELVLGLLSLMFTYLYLYFS